MQLRATTKFGAVEPLLDLPHGGRTRIRASVNSASAARFEGGTDPVAVRLAGLGALARAGYPVGLTIAPIMPLGDWRAEYGALLDAAAAELADVPGLDLTVECITHRFTPASKEVLEGWYPRTKLEMDPDARTPQVRQVRGGQVRLPSRRDARAAHLVRRRPRHPLPVARTLYWT